MHKFLLLFIFFETTTLMGMHITSKDQEKDLLSLNVDEEDDREVEQLCSGFQNVKFVSIANQLERPPSVVVQKSPTNAEPTLHNSPNPQSPILTILNQAVQNDTQEKQRNTNGPRKSILKKRVNKSLVAAFKKIKIHESPLHHKQ